MSSEVPISHLLIVRDSPSALLACTPVSLDLAAALHLHATDDGQVRLTVADVGPTEFHDQLWLWQVVVERMFLHPTLGFLNLDHGNERLQQQLHKRGLTHPLVRSLRQTLNDTGKALVVLTTPTIQPPALPGSTVFIDRIGRLELVESTTIYRPRSNHRGSPGLASEVEIPAQNDRY